MGESAIKQIVQLTWVTFDVVEFVLKPRSIKPEIDRASPIAFTYGANVPARYACGQEEEIIIREDCVIPHRLRWVLDDRNDALADAIGLGIGKPARSSIVGNKSR
jgi:hypothetical protein